MAELGVMLFIAAFPTFRMWWVYRLKAHAIHAMSILSKKDMDAGISWESRHNAFEAEEISLWNMFFQLHKWTVFQFFSVSLSRV
jgi:hypothetical protein